MSHEFPTAEYVDVMLLLEGTFPYVSGGVSSWVSQVIRAFPEIRFGAVFIGSSPDEYGEPKYTLPSNLVHLEVHYLHGGGDHPEPAPCKGNPAAFKVIEQLHSFFIAPTTESMPAELHDTAFFRTGGQGVDYTQFLYSEESWKFITHLYRQRSTDPSFVDYFWTVRNMHGPIWQLATIADSLIPAGVYHTLSTGYAGFLGALLQHNTGRPLLLSEHGIYTKERRIDIFHSNWIRDNRNALQHDPTEISYYRDLWIRFFETLGRICYLSSRHIVSLYEGARLREIADGADRAKTMVVPNGVDVQRFLPVRNQHGVPPPKVLALLGRVVPIKDVKTFIRAIKILSELIPGVEGWVVGPDDENPAYAAECHALVENLAIGGNVRFTGFMNPVELFPQVGLLVLSSISEGLPLVALEGFAAGIPLISTEVGSCAQLVNGLGPDDEPLGRAGAIVPINNPQAIADAAYHLLETPGAWDRARQSAIDRVELHYTLESMVARYRTLYEEGLARWQV